MCLHCSFESRGWFGYVISFIVSGHGFSHSLGVDACVPDIRRRENSVVLLGLRIQSSVLDETSVKLEQQLKTNHNNYL
jgi:hypothetical protein